MPETKPFFSVVIPLYNKAHYIEACVKSVLQQRFSDFELLIVNDGSTDASIQKLASFDDHRIQLFHQANKGAAVARNKGVVNAKAEFIAFLDADDLWKENHLFEIYHSILQFPEEKVFTTKLSRFEANQKIEKGKYNFKESTQIEVLAYFKNSLKSDLLNTSGLVIQKAFFNELGGFNEAIVSGQDTDLFIRIGLETDVVFNPLSTFVYRPATANNLSKTPRFKERLALLTAYEEEAKTNLDLKKYLDVNRFSILLRSKMYGDDAWKIAQHQIDTNNLSKKQMMVFKLPKLALISLKQLQLILKKLGIKKSIF